MNGGVADFACCIKPFRYLVKDHDWTLNLQPRAGNLEWEFCDRLVDFYSALLYCGRISQGEQLGELSCIQGNQYELLLEHFWVVCPLVSAEHDFL